MDALPVSQEGEHFVISVDNSLAFVMALFLSQSCLLTECPWLMLMHCEMVCEHGRALSTAARARSTSDGRGCFCL